MSKKISVTFREILDAPLSGSWEYICEKYGLNEWCIKEGRADDDDTIEITINDAYYIGILPEKEKSNDNENNQDIKEKVKENSVVQVNEKGQDGWIGCLIIVSEVKNWGVKGYVQIPDERIIPIRLRWEEIEYVGESVLIKKTETDEA